MGLPCDRDVSTLVSRTGRGPGTGTKTYPVLVVCGQAILPLTMVPHGFPYRPPAVELVMAPVSGRLISGPFRWESALLRASTEGQRSYCSFAYSALACLKVRM